MNKKGTLAQLSSVQFSSVQSLSPVQLFATPWTSPHQIFLSITNSWSLLKLMSIKLVMPSNHLILCCPLLLLPSIFPSIGSFLMSQCFSSGGQSTGVSVSASVLPKNIQDWFPLLIKPWTARFDLFAVQGTLKSLFPHHSSKASILWHSAFFMVQLSHPHMTTGETIPLTRWTFVSKVMPPLCKMLLKFIKAFLPRSKCLLISWLQSPSEANF